MNDFLKGWMVAGTLVAATAVFAYLHPWNAVAAGVLLLVLSHVLFR